jgi:hypothetical protein
MKEIKANTALAIIFLATAVMLIGGLAVIPTATSPVQEAYADATTCTYHAKGSFECYTVGKNPKSCSALSDGIIDCPELSNRETGRSSGALHRECASGDETCTLEGGQP